MSSSHRLLQQIKKPSLDPIFSLISEFQRDTRKYKVDLGIGVYRDEFGKTPIMKSVQDAQQILIEKQDSKSYLSLTGNTEFNQASLELLFAKYSIRNRARAIQTPGGSGAYYLFSQLLRNSAEPVTVWVPEQGYPNHTLTMISEGIEVKTYPYLCLITQSIDEARLLEALSNIPYGDVVVLHGCCHNPTGIDLSRTLWKEITALSQIKGFLPLIDLAYLGLGHGLEQDLYGLSYMAEHLDDLLIAVSFSKNFGLYRERAGCAIILSEKGAVSESIVQYLSTVACKSYAMSPDYGASIISEILSTPYLFSSWKSELEQMNKHLSVNREILHNSLIKVEVTHLDQIRASSGFFCLTGLTHRQQNFLRYEHGIYTTLGGRINISGLNKENCDYVAYSISKSISAHN
ncbi:aromatic amino acid transaminase [Vibrio cholerae]|uniref:aromatic amino acid transaminase n=1 Tax=Vibrio cholerae TaxID=666 RepID=UPI003967C51C|nr:aromatic amino acid transaminase [Vibrio cholerae]EJL6694529.1 aromatic amino acid transaminase [Vibrio cholerae]